MIHRERGFVRHTLDHFVIDPEGMGLDEMKAEIDAALSSDLPQAVKDNAFMQRRTDRDGFPDWRLVWDRPETDTEMAERIAAEELKAWNEFARLVGLLKDSEFPRHHHGLPAYENEQFFLDPTQTQADVMKIARNIGFA